ncbi:MAG: diacylglycerol kinase [Candidatus Pacebacteria bacterium]|nr:diacylglycerol kinase [Candidatus Paceibacterota bacterium]
MEPGKPKDTNIFQASIYALHGVKALSSHRAIRHESLLLGFWLVVLFGFKQAAALPIVTLCAVLLACEALNSAIENLCDHITPEFNAQIKVVKDMAAAASLILVVIIIIQIGYFVDGLIRPNRSVLVAILRGFVYPAFLLNYFVVVGLSILAALALIKRRWLLVLFFALLIKFWFQLFFEIIPFQNGLGDDSIAVAFNFKLSEAKAYFDSLYGNQFLSLFNSGWLVYEVLINSLLVVNFVLVYWLVRALTSFQIRWLNLRRCLHWGGVGFIVVSLLILFNKTEKLIYRHFANQAKSSQKLNSADAPIAIPDLSNKNAQLNLVVYIGESTSRMNFQLYGYFRDTTPKLQAIKDSSKNLLVFNNIFSTFSHTNESLNQALTLGTNPTEGHRPIFMRNRIPLSAQLAEWRIQSQLYSSQCSDRACEPIFKQIFGTIEHHFSTEVKAPFDSDYLLPNLSQFITSLDSKSGNRMIYLHSYAGHDDYRDNSPPDFRTEIDSQLRDLGDKQITGNNAHHRVEAYDSVIRYIDSNLSQSIALVQKTAKPIVFIYFSDHGESPYANSGHDSSRFIHEMLTIPFLLYFNDAAIKAYPELFKKYQRLAASGRVGTLDQFSTTVIDLLGFDLEQINNRGIVMEKPIGSRLDILPPLLIRDRVDYVSSIDLNSDPKKLSAANLQPALVDQSDPATRVFRASAQVLGGNRLVCTDHVDNVATGLRAVFSSDCYRINIAVNSPDSLEVLTPKLQPMNQDLAVVEKANRRFKKPVWLNIDNLNPTDKCGYLADYVVKHRPNAKGLLIEFPATTPLDSLATADCLQSLSKMGLQPIIRIDERLAIDCSNSLASSAGAINNSSCFALNKQLQAIQLKKGFTEISFNFQGIRAIRQMPFAQYFKWNITNVPAEAIYDLQDRPIHALAVDSRDPNLTQ